MHNTIATTWFPKVREVVISAAEEDETQATDAKEVSEKTQTQTQTQA
jgi:hypothetical protein